MLGSNGIVVLWVGVLSPSSEKSEIIDIDRDLECE